jgi:hypothetical protein
VKLQHGKPFLWCLVDDQAEKQPHEFRNVWTGAAMGDGWTNPEDASKLPANVEYVESFQTPREYASHLFLRRPLETPSKVVPSTVVSVDPTEILT